MPKSIVIEPEKYLPESTIHLSDIEVNAYQRTGDEERAAYSPRSSWPFAGYVRHPAIRDHSQRDQDQGRVSRPGL